MRSRRPEIHAGKWLEWWLNEGKDRRGDKARIAGLLPLLQHLEQLIHDSKELDGWAAGIDAVEEQIRTRMLPYAGRPGFAAPFDEREGMFVQAITEPIAGGVEEWHAIGYLQDLARAGGLRRLTICDVCGKRWVFKFGRRLHCSDACRKAKHESKPERQQAKKAWRKNADRDLREETRQFRLKRKGRKRK